VLRAFHLRHGSGGDGQFKGGDGVVRMVGPVRGGQQGDVSEVLGGERGDMSEVLGGERGDMRAVLSGERGDMRAVLSGERGDMRAVLGGQQGDVILVLDAVQGANPELSGGSGAAQGNMRMPVLCKHGGACMLLPPGCPWTNKRTTDGAMGPQQPCATLVYAS